MNKDKVNFSKKRLNYKRYLVGESCENFLIACGCDPKIANIEDRKTLTITAIDYRNPLFHFCEDLNMTTDQIVKKYKRVDRFSNDLAEIIHQKLLRLVGRVNSGKIRRYTIGNFQSAVQKFCNANWININWNVIRKSISFKNLNTETNDLAYTREQIKKLLLFTPDIRMRVAILFMSHGGLRREAMTDLLHKDITPIEINGELICARVVTYNEDHGSYITFVTPEAYNLYVEYIEQRKRYGENITGNSPVLIRRFDKSNKQITINPRAISPSTLGSNIGTFLIDSGIRELSDKYDHRYTVKCLHGFRKYFYETLKKVKKADGSRAIDIMMCYTLLGDKSQLKLRAPLDPAYDKKTDSEFEEKELLETYRLAIPDLTINDEMRERELRKKVERELKDLTTLKVELEQVKQDKNQENQEVQDLKQEVQQLREMMVTISKSGVTIPVNNSQQVVEHVKTKYYDARNTNLTPDEVRQAIIKGETSKVGLKRIPYNKFQFVDKEQHDQHQKRLANVAVKLNTTVDDVCEIWTKGLKPPIVNKIDKKK